ncbi:MAG TPA: hypothetical protein VH234_05910 [Candidatus Saccharimonadales bacterium]|jgi:hypothetical protein|nr:hypothetical protein [Candidatus Saccharimonadales bacterium]
MRGDNIEGAGGVPDPSRHDEVEGHILNMVRGNALPSKDFGTTAVRRAIIFFREHGGAAIKSAQQEMGIEPVDPGENDSIPS